MKYARYIKNVFDKFNCHGLDKLDVPRALMFGIS